MCTFEDSHEEDLTAPNKTEEYNAILVQNVKDKSLAQMILNFQKMRTEKVGNRETYSILLSGFTSPEEFQSNFNLDIDCKTAGYLLELCKPEFTDIIFAKIMASDPNVNTLIQVFKRLALKKDISKIFECWNFMKEKKMQPTVQIGIYIVFLVVNTHPLLKILRAEKHRKRPLNESEFEIVEKLLQRSEEQSRTRWKTSQIAFNAKRKQLK